MTLNEFASTSKNVVIAVREGKKKLLYPIQTKGLENRKVKNWTIYYMDYGSHITAEIIVNLSKEE